MTRRGDIVRVQFPFAGGAGGKERPAVIVQADRLNQRIQSTVVVMVTGNTKRVGKEPTQFLVDPSNVEGQSSGLSYPSAVKCENPVTVRQADIKLTLGRLSDTLMARLDASLKAAFDLP